MKTLIFASLACLVFLTGCTLILIGGGQPKTKPSPSEPARSEPARGRPSGNRPAPQPPADRGATGRGEAAVPAPAQGPTGQGAERLTIPPGHLSPPGECRVWRPGDPPGRQAPSGPCASLLDDVPPGGWLIYRPEERANEVAVNVYHEKRAKVAEVRYFDFWTGRLLRVEDR